jgi:hypothetical protein
MDTCEQDWQLLTRQTMCVCVCMEPLQHSGCTPTTTFLVMQLQALRGNRSEPWFASHKDRHHM